LIVIIIIIIIEEEAPQKHKHYWNRNTPQKWIHI